MDGLKFFQAWDNFLGLFRAANMPNQNTNPPSEDREVPQDELGDHEEPLDKDAPSEDDTDKQSDTGGSEDHSETDPTDPTDDTNASEPDNVGRDNPIPRVNGSIAVAFSVFCRQAFDSVVMKVEVTVSKVKDFISNAIQTFKEKGFWDTAKEAGAWMKAHPWETARIVAPIVAVIITAITLFAVGFGPAGVAAGSTAAIIQAGIGNVVANSLFATCTSAMMGGSGGLIIFGGVWAMSTVTTAASMSAWKRWKSRNDQSVVLFPGVAPNDISKKMKDAAENFVVGSMLLAAYVTYRIKSWLQSRRRTKSD
ncbi:hypothetical protein COCVIDRAFT_16477 [Bipolaris victoriae FI3]|uniref:Uncharacterized protein n=1 Tax=Bipolaris victoriae (strain FI3) TaxID=930091 RepID=W7EHY8_BIPV3|nr:hypothetical protein COCVIDRAFT_16477 [Bipolaris victoriae FI3]